MSERNLAVRKQLGQFYTPHGEAASFAAWAIRSGSDRILEPSVGDGALLLPALALARELGGVEGPSAIACDVDQTAVDQLRTRFGPEVELVQGDFFTLDPANAKLVDVVLANPPFTRNHQMSSEMRAGLRARYPLKGAAGLWAYFVLHARKFLRPGGRMAFVVPAAAIFTDYSASLLAQLSEEFRDIALYELPAKPAWIGAADERGALLIVDGYQAGPAKELRRGLWSYVGMPLHVGGGASTAPPSFQRLLGACRPLASLADLSIGLVTGSNRTFLLSGAEVDASGLDRADLVRVISRARQARTIKIELEDLESPSSRNEKTWLLHPRDLGARGGPVRSRLATINSARRRETVWFNKRDPWWRVDTGSACDAVFTYMNDQGPTLSLVPPGVVCTNTLHRVAFKATTSEADRIAAVLTFVSTFGQLFAEGHGRAYGGGVLKFELREARSFPILPASPATTALQMSAVDTALRAGDRNRARELADEALLEPVLGPSWRTSAQELGYILTEVRAARRRGEGRLMSAQAHV